MKVHALISLLVISGLVGGCSRRADLPADLFQLTVREIVSDAEIQVWVLGVRAAQGAGISVDGERIHTYVALADAPDARLREGEVFLSAARIAPKQSDEAYIQTLIRPMARGGRASLSSVHTIPRDTTLSSFFSVSAKTGTYQMDSPVTIAHLQGQPVMLVVGKPTTRRPDGSADAGQPLSFATNSTLD